jgi:hypothetical protein
MKKRIFAVVSALVLIVLSCSHEVEDDPVDNQGNETPNETPTETPAEDGKTYIEFHNQESFPVRIYQDPGLLHLLIEDDGRHIVRIDGSGEPPFGTGHFLFA